MGARHSRGCTPCQPSKPALVKPTIRKELGDGNCLFYALARQCKGDPTRAADVRREVCDWVENHLCHSVLNTSQLLSAHRNDIEKQLEGLGIVRDDRALKQYTKKMAANHEWGSGLEALSAAYKYKRPVCIWQEGDAIEGKPTARIIPPCATGNPVGLKHNGENHWDSVLLPATYCVDAPAYRVIPGKRQPTAKEKADDIQFQGEGPKVTALAKVQRSDLSQEEKRQQRLDAVSRRSNPAMRAGDVTRKKRAVQLARTCVEAAAGAGNSVAGNITPNHECHDDLPVLEALGFLDPEQVSEAVCTHRATVPSQENILRLNLVEAGAPELHDSSGWRK